MKKLGYLLFPVLAITLMLGGNAFAQGDNSSYFVTYYSNANTTGAPDATLRIVNDGDASTAQSEGVPNGNLSADIYLFDDSQELQECCSCLVSPDGLLSESVNKELTANELTGRAETSRGVIKVISDVYPGNPTAPTPTPGLRGWMTHIQAGATKTTFNVTETPLADSNLSAAEEQALGQLCSFAITLGSGYGVCSCTPEDHDF
jgi:hypothetical protein